MRVSCPTDPDGLVKRKRKNERINKQKKPVQAESPRIIIDLQLMLSNSDTMFHFFFLDNRRLGKNTSIINTPMQAILYIHV